MEPADQVAEPTLGIRPTQEEHVHTRDVIRALGSLPEEQRSVLFLVVVEDLSYSEVAEVLAIPIGTVMSRLARARERLRRILESGPPVALRSVN